MSEIVKNAFANINPESEQFVKKNLDIVDEIFALMEEKGLSSQKELAKLLNKRESEISKLLSGLQNLTLRSITNLEVALGEDIIMTCSKAKKKYVKVNYIHVKEPATKNRTSLITNSDIRRVNYSEPVKAKPVLKLA